MKFLYSSFDRLYYYKNISVYIKRLLFTSLNIVQFNQIFFFGLKDLMEGGHIFLLKLKILIYALFFLIINFILFFFNLTHF